MTHITNKLCCRRNNFKYTAQTTVMAGLARATIGARVCMTLNMSDRRYNAKIIISDVNQQLSQRKWHLCIIERNASIIGVRNGIEMWKPISNRARALESNPIMGGIMREGVSSGKESSSRCAVIPVCMSMAFGLMTETPVNVNLCVCYDEWHSEHILTRKQLIRLQRGVWSCPSRKKLTTNQARHKYELSILRHERQMALLPANENGAHSGVCWRHCNDCHQTQKRCCGERR